MKKIVVVGSLNMDLITQTDQVPQKGETVEGSKFGTVCGGKGGNQACAAAKLGGKSVMLGCVGQDIFGKELVAGLVDVNVDCSEIEVCRDMESGTASITVSGGDNSIIVVPGANAKVTTGYVKKHLEKHRDAGIIMLQMEIPLETIEYVISYAAQQNIAVLLNPSPVKDIADDLLCKVKYVIVNEIECAYYSGVPVKSVEDAGKGLQKILDKGVEQVIVTLGGQGAVFNCGSEICHMEAEQVTAVDSTAAGDTFAAAIAVALLEGQPIKNAVRFAATAGTIAVTKMGAQTSIPFRKEVDEKIREIL